MQIPANIPGLKLATVLTAVYTAVWVSLEGDLRWVVSLGLAVSLISAAQLLQRGLGGRTLSFGPWLLVAAGLGLFVGLGSGLLALFFMVLKTGLHAHGPEFSPAEIAWVIRQIPLWSTAGLLGGLGFGLLTTTKG